MFASILTLTRFRPLTRSVRSLPMARKLLTEPLPASPNRDHWIAAYPNQEYEDKVALTFNYSGDDRTITLKEIDGGLQQGVRIPLAVVHQKPRKH